MLKIIPDIESTEKVLFLSYRQDDVFFFFFLCVLFEPPDDKNNKMLYAPSEDSDQPGHLSSLISLHCALNR